MSSQKLALTPYGLNLDRFATMPTQIEIELLYIANATPEAFGGLDRSEHIRRAIKILWPWVWKYWHEWNDLCLWAWCNYQEIGTTGCASAHKTFTFSLLAELEWLAKPTATGVVLTSTTIGALRGRIWAEIKRFYEQASIQFGYNIVDSMQKIQSKKGDDKFSIRGMAVESGQIEKAVGNLQGVHPERMVLIVDEAAQTPDAIFTARSNLSTGTTFYRFVAIANASDQFDGHGKFCEPKNGWSSVTSDTETYETRSGICLHFNGLKSPNVKRKTTHFPRLFAQSDIDQCRTRFGENSLEWYSYVLGWWAPRGVRNTVLDAATIMDGRAKEEPVWEGTATKMYAALDPAFTTGGDRCVIRMMKVGNFVDGKIGLYSYKPTTIKLIESTTNPLNYQIADFVIAFCLDNGITADRFSMDATSASGLVDVISQRWGTSEFRKVAFGTAPTDGPVSFEDKREAKKVYKNRVTQIWYSVFRLVQAGRIRGLDDATAKEFCTRQYALVNERTEVEAKKDMKKRTGGESPDFADPFALIVDHVLHTNSEITQSTQAPQVSEEWQLLRRRTNLKSSYASSY